MFRREERYCVLKHTDIIDALDADEKEQLIALEEKVALYRQMQHKAPLVAVVVESDWPEYETVWDMIKSRCHEEGGCEGSDRADLVEPLHVFDQYKDTKRALFDYFGYKEDWVTIPLEDYRDMYWFLTGEGYGGEVIYAENSLTLRELNAGIRDDGEYYSAEIYTQRFLPQWVYYGKDFTMVCMDTQCDGNKYLGIFDNSKHVG